MFIKQKVPNAGFPRDTSPKKYRFRKFLLIELKLLNYPSLGPHFGQNSPNDQFSSYLGFWTTRHTLTNSEKKLEYSMRGMASRGAQSYP